MRINCSHQVKHPLLVVLCTTPDEATATQIARNLLENRLAACVNVIPKVQSIYLWDGQLCEDSEVQMVIKTSTSHFKALESAILAEHPYDCPEIIGLPVSEVTKKYDQWLQDSL